TNIWVVNESSSNVTKLRASDGNVLATVPVGAQPLGVAFDGANVWVANLGGGAGSKLWRQGSAPSAARLRRGRSAAPSSAGASAPDLFRSKYAAKCNRSRSSPSAMCNFAVGQLGLILYCFAELPTLVPQTQSAFHGAAEHQNEAPNHALQRTPGFGVQLPGTG